MYEQLNFMKPFASLARNTKLVNVCQELIVTYGRETWSNNNFYGKSTYSVYVNEFYTRLFSYCCNTSTLLSAWVDIHLVAADTVKICIMGIKMNVK